MSVADAAPGVSVAADLIPDADVDAEENVDIMLDSDAPPGVNVAADLIADATGGGGDGAGASAEAEVNVDVDMDVETDAGVSVDADFTPVAAAAENPSSGWAIVNVDSPCIVADSAPAVGGVRGVTAAPCWLLESIVDRVSRMKTRFDLFSSSA